MHLRALLSNIFQEAEMMASQIPKRFDISPAGKAL